MRDKGRSQKIPFLLSGKAAVSILVGTAEGPKPVGKEEEQVKSQKDIDYVSR